MRKKERGKREEEIDIIREEGESRGKMWFA